jgi:hypothetical protein
MLERTSLRSCAVAFLSSLAFAGVLRVAPSGAPYTTPQDAIDAAVDGDTILIAPGSYPGFTIPDVALAIAVDLAGTVSCGGVDVENLSSTRNVLIDSLRLTSATGYGLKIRACSGSVRVQSCTLRGADANIQSNLHASQGAYITGSTDVVLRRCTIDGGHGDGVNPSFARGQDGLFARGSRLALYGCTLRGGAGAFADPNGWDLGGDGGDGLETPDSFILAQETSFTGGTGGDGGDGDFLQPGNGGGRGGNGVLLHADQAGTSPEVVTRACHLTGGPGGYGGFWGGPDGPPGLPAMVDVGTVRTSVQKAVIDVDTPSNWPIGSMVPIRIAGSPGSIVELLVAPDTGFVSNATTDYPRHVPNPIVPLFRRLGVGVVPPSGSITLNVTVPSPPAGIPTQAWYLQAWTTNPDSGPTSSLACVVLY